MTCACALTTYLEEQIAGSDAWPPRRRDALVGTLRTKPGLFRLLRRTKAGLLRLDRAAASREAKLGGKWLLRTSNASLTAEDPAAAYKQLYQVERGWRDLRGAARPGAASARSSSACTSCPSRAARAGSCGAHARPPASARSFAALELPEPPLFSAFEVAPTPD